MTTSEGDYLPSRFQNLFEMWNLGNTGRETEKNGQLVERGKSREAGLRSRERMHENEGIQKIVLDALYWP